MLHCIRRLVMGFRRLLRRVSATQIIVFAFLAIILSGSMLLMLPVSSRDGQSASFITALFTATSATCVTGLSVVDTFTQWSGFGQAVILCMIQVGGLGFMTIASLAFMMVNRKMGLKNRMVLAQSMGLDQMDGILRMVRHVLVGTFSIELIGAVVLTLRFLSCTTPGKAVWWGVFHSVAAFCNAGFDVLGAVESGGSLIPFCTDLTVNVTLMILIIVGGLGFFVWEDILEKRSFRKLTVYSRLVLIISGVLVVGGALMFLLLEWNNPQTLGALTTPQKILAGFFHSVSTRTAGFYTFSQAELTDASKIVTDLLMFIGGSSGSTAGGVKTVTIGVVLLSVIATARGRSRLTVFHRTISSQQIRNAVSVVTMVFFLGLVSGMIVSVTNGLDVMDCLYETISAIATVGLSTGITGGLNLLSKCILIVLMFFGRVGVMTISLGFLMPDQAEERYHFAETNLLIG